jgi:hypothetical protein
MFVPAVIDFREVCISSRFPHQHNMHGNGKRFPLSAFELWGANEAETYLICICNDLRWPESLTTFSVI